MIIKRIFFLYQDIFFFIAQARNEAGKWTGLFTEFALLILLLDKFEVKLSWQLAVVAYVVLMLIMYVIGLLLDKIGVVKYNIYLSNKRNEVLNKIHHNVKALVKRK